jgi:hypothetical protein
MLRRIAPSAPDPEWRLPRFHRAAMRREAMSRSPGPDQHAQGDDRDTGQTVHSVDRAPYRRHRFDGAADPPVDLSHDPARALQPQSQARSCHGPRPARRRRCSAGCRDGTGCGAARRARPAEKHQTLHRPPALGPAYGASARGLRAWLSPCGAFPARRGGPREVAGLAFATGAWGSKAAAELYPKLRDGALTAGAFDAARAARTVRTARAAYGRLHAAMGDLGTCRPQPALRTFSQARRPMRGVISALLPASLAFRNLRTRYSRRCRKPARTAPASPNSCRPPSRVSPGFPPCRPGATLSTPPRRDPSGPLPERGRFAASARSPVESGQIAAAGRAAANGHRR